VGFGAARYALIAHTCMCQPSSIHGSVYATSERRGQIIATLFSSRISCDIHGTYKVVGAPFNLVALDVKKKSTEIYALLYVDQTRLKENELRRST
jgi:hypothetical protein